jgi:pimeloyl-ACP methyl ester carboxylesterase
VVRDIFGLLRKTQSIGQIDIIGHSMGGKIAMF